MKVVFPSAACYTIPIIHTEVMRLSSIGLYLHLPFCRSKCPYCDFYSLRADADGMDGYTAALLRDLSAWGERLQCSADTIYLGGGTPSQLGGARLARILRQACQSFPGGDGEITVECNPSDGSPELFDALAAAGVNRISLGFQTVAEEERKALGRRTPPSQLQRVIGWARQAGIHNISLDLMLGIPHQTAKSLQKSLDFCLSSGASHISAYLLKVEEDTPFYKRRDSLPLPEEEEVCDFYLMTVEQMERAGFPQYEISNFSLPGRESRHNLKYWNGEEYLGLGPSAHSFLQGERFFFPNNLQEYLACSQQRSAGTGGDFEEYAMLRLRLREGLTEALVQQRFHHAIPVKMWERARPFEEEGLLVADGKGIRLTPKGFLLSNRLIAELIF